MSQTAAPIAERRTDRQGGVPIAGRENTKGAKIYFAPLRFPLFPLDKLSGNEERATNKWAAGHPVKLPQAPTGTLTGGLFI